MKKNLIKNNGAWKKNFDGSLICEETMCLKLVIKVRFKQTLEQTNCLT